MKVVIDISENEYKFLQQCVKSGVGSKGDKYIANGTVLPKEHGDLIDRDTVQMSAEKFHSLGDLYTAQWLVDIAPTVIEADKGE